eukprot:SM000171S03256  [mRNA]  locus=s171:306117:308386:- [translate_table: standard]
MAGERGSRDYGYVLSGTLVEEPYRTVNLRLPFRPGSSGGAEPSGDRTGRRKTAAQSPLRCHLGSGRMAGEIPVADQKTLVLVNTFIVNTVQLLNSISGICEDNLAKISRRIQRLDVQLLLLEAKLRSLDDQGVGRADRQPVTEPALHDLPGFTDVQDDSPPAPCASQDTGTSRAEPTHVGQHVDITIAPDATLAPADGRQKSDMPKVKDDPRYSRFFRMLHVGVPAQAVKMQMSLESLDPYKLDQADAPASP